MQNRLFANISLYYYILFTRHTINNMPTKSETMSPKQKRRDFSFFFNFFLSTFSMNPLFLTPHIGLSYFTYHPLLPLSPSQQSCEAVYVIASGDCVDVCYAEKNPNTVPWPFQSLRRLLVLNVLHLLHFSLNDFSVCGTRTDHRSRLIATGLTYFRRIRPTAALSRTIQSSRFKT